MWAKIISIKRTKDLNYFSLCAFNLFNNKFHNLSLTAEINDLFHNILIYWDAPVYASHVALQAKKHTQINNKGHLDEEKTKRK